MSQVDSGLTTGVPWASGADTDGEGSATGLWRAPLPPAVARTLAALDGPLDARPAAGALPPSGLVAAVAWLVGRYGLSTRIPIGVGVGRGSPHVLPLALDVPRDITWEALSAQVVRARAEGGPPRSYSTLREEGDSVEAPGPFPVLVAAGDFEERSLDGGALVVHIAGGSDPALIVRYRRRWLAEETARRLGLRLLRLLTELASSPDASMSDVDLLDEEERTLLLGDWAGTSVPYPRDASVTALLHEVAETNPRRLAVESPERSVTYAELLHESAEVRARLRSAGIEPGRRVGVLMPRAVSAIAAICGILEHACTYVPLDPADPHSRIRGICKDADLAGVLVTAELEPALRRALEGFTTTISVLSVPSPPPAEDFGEASKPGRREPPTPEALRGGGRAAYVMYTSGSTGRPNGVEIPHRGIVRLVRNNDFMEMQDGERVLGFAPFTFDPSTWEIWAPLLNGGTLVLAPQGRPSLAELARYVSHRGITTANFASALFQEIVEYQLEHLSRLRQLMSGGDVVSLEHAMKVGKRWPDTTMLNAYGPTENSFLTTAHRVESSDAHRRSLPIGRPIRNTTVFVLDHRLRLMPPGMPGELYTGGDGLALGYVNRPDLDAQRFIEAPFLEVPESRLYRTGDLVRHLPDGSLEFLGRVDDQVKIRGFRVEPGEVEKALAGVSGVALAAVVAVGSEGDRRLRAGVVLEPGSRLDARALGASLRERVPEYMVPAEFLFLDRLPSTSRGKIDRHALAELPTPAAYEPRGSERAEHADETEALVRDVWASLLPGRAFGPEDTFFDVGGSSLLALRMVEELRLRMGIDLPVVRVFEFPTVRALAHHLRRRELPEEATRPTSGITPVQAGDSQAVAIIGMAGRFPGADDVDQLWELLREGREGIRRFTDEELETPSEVASRPNFVPCRGVLNDVEDFDAAFFRITPRQAAITDPQHRLLLEAAWQAFEDAGVVPGEGPHLAGAFVGVSQNTYYERNVRSHGDAPGQAGSLDVVFGNDKDYVSNLLAQKLDLRGPTVTVQTASSTSLTALAMAVQALRTGSCDLALAGGASVTVPVRSGHVHEEGAMFSRDGRTRTFDRYASGTVFSDGVAMVLLKRLEDARRDGDRIQAVIHGAAVTNDGAHRASFTAPTVDGQALAISRALADAGWSADSISYVEAHGTATPIGDPIEMEALSRAFRKSTERKHFCLIGSAKSNLGHLSAAAGVTGIIKSVLAMRHGWVPPTLHFQEANPAIDFDESPFVVARFGAPWKTEKHPRRAGVSSFGAGGTNVHIVLEEWPLADGSPRARSPEPVEPVERPELLPLSAPTPDALTDRVRGLARWLARDPDTPDNNPSLYDVGHTLQEGRKAFDHRTFVVTRTREGARAALQSIAMGTDIEPGARGTPRPGGPVPIFMFPGQGTQVPGMAAELYESFPAVRARLDECGRLLGPLKGRGLRSWIADGAARAEEADVGLRETEVAQPALFAVQYAVAGALMDWGVRPRAMIGHSIGELTAACLAGVMDLATALRVVRERGRIMSTMPPGAMTAVRTDAERLESLLDDVGMEVAAYNAPRLITVSGPLASAERLEARLEQEGIVYRRLETSHAFHSRLMEEGSARFHDFLAGVPLATPHIPFVSGAFGRMIREEEATDPGYWARQLRDPVRFTDGIRALGELPGAHFMDLGPRATLGTLVRQTLTSGDIRYSSAMGAPGTPETSPAEALLRTAGELWIGGQAIRWDVLRQGWRARKIGLPGYPFQRKCHWLEPSTSDGYVDADERAHGHRTRLGDDPAPSFESVVEAQRRIIRRQTAILDTLRDGAESRDDPTRS